MKSLQLHRYCHVTYKQEHFSIMTHYDRCKCSIVHDAMLFSINLQNKYTYCTIISDDR